MIKPKRKSKSSPRKSILKVIGILIAIPLLSKLFCYGFAKYGGELASENVLPIYQESVFVDAEYDLGFNFSIKRSVFTSNQSPEYLREWFNTQSIWLSPLPSNVEGTEFYEHDGYYGTMYLFDMSNTIQKLHMLASVLSGWFNEFTRTCQNVRVYYDLGKLRRDFPQIIVESKTTYYVLSTCWPNIK